MARWTGRNQQSEVWTVSQDVECMGEGKMEPFKNRRFDFEKNRFSRAGWESALVYQGLPGGSKEGGAGTISAAQIGFREEDFDENPLQANLRAMWEAN